MRSRLLICAFAALSACTEGETDEAAQFAAALNEYYANNPECVRVGQPADENGVVAEVREDRVPRDGDVSKLDALVSEELLEVRVVDVELRAIVASRPGETAPARRYSLTEKGADFLQRREEANRMQMGSSAFCYGHRKVTEITNFTEPADAFGQRVATVAYTFELMDVPAWARGTKVTAAFPEIARETSGRRSDSTDLVLTDEGWVHHRLAP
ncbi:hypothetical protein [Parvularcula oceani]|uniref:hypothetical protein n=1 Tax=Parvularcula oceani TaxID=1247963 RepID=UPI0006922A56|nr:hypothetical protein [Parvularcula oceani]